MNKSFNPFMSTQNLCKRRNWPLCLIPRDFDSLIVADNFRLRNGGSGRELARANWLVNPNVKICDYGEPTRMALS
jgi:hypothetical protein